MLGWLGVRVGGNKGCEGVSIYTYASLNGALVECWRDHTIDLHVFGGGKKEKWLP